MPLVTLRLHNDLPIPIPVEDVAVEFYNTSAEFQTSSTTDVFGEVSVLLPDGTYDVVFYLPGLTILPRQPQRIIVSSLLSNIFLIYCHERVLPESLNPRRCKISGKVLGVDGGIGHTRLVFCLSRELLIYDNAFVDMANRIEVASDDQGYFEFELLRNTEYVAFFLHLDSFLGIPPPASLTIKTTNAAGMELDKLLFPLPLAATFSDSAISLAVDPSADPDVSIDADVVWSDGNTRWASSVWSGVMLLNDHPEVAEISVLSGVVVIKPLSPGIASAIIARTLTDKAVFDPLPGFVSDTLVVTVTL